MKTMIVTVGILWVLLCTSACDRQTGEDAAPSVQVEKKPADKAKAAKPGKEKGKGKKGEGKERSIFSPNLLSFEKSRLKASGDLDPAVFKRVMGKRKSSFKVCYRKALASNPEARGEVRVGFGISPTGRVSTVKVLESGLSHPETEACLIRVIRRIQFPPLESGQWVNVEYPLVFSP